MAVSIIGIASIISAADPSVTMTTSSGDVLVACIGIHQGDVSTNQVNYGNSVITQGPHSSTAFKERSEIWYHLTPPVGTFTLTFDGTGGGGRELVGYVLSGVKTTGQPNASGGDNGNSSTSSVLLTTTSDNCLIIDNHYSEGNFTVVGTGQSSVAILQAQSFENAATSYFPQGTSGAKTMSWAIGSGQRWAATAIAFEPAAGTVVTTNFLSLLGVGT